MTLHAQQPNLRFSERQDIYDRVATVADFLQPVQQPAAGLPGVKADFGDQLVLGNRGPLPEDVYPHSPETVDIDDRLFAEPQQAAVGGPHPDHPVFDLRQQNAAARCCGGDPQPRVIAATETILETENADVSLADGDDAPWP